MHLRIFRRSNGVLPAVWPLARQDDLVTTESGDEVLIYDERVHHIHHLNAATSTVWRLCDGQRTIERIAADAGLGQDAAMMALRQLDEARLLEGPLSMPIPDARQGISRRSVAKMGLAAVPAIVSISAPIAKDAASGGGLSRDEHCWDDDDCSQGLSCIGRVLDFEAGTCQ